MFTSSKNSPLFYSQLNTRQPYLGAAFSSAPGAGTSSGQAVMLSWAPAPAPAPAPVVTASAPAPVMLAPAPAPASAAYVSAIDQSSSNPFTSQARRIPGATYTSSAQAVTSGDEVSVALPDGSSAPTAAPSNATPQKSSAFPWLALIAAGAALFGGG